MSKEKKEKLLRACELVKAQNDQQTDISNLVALSMQTGYELGKQEATGRLLATDAQGV